MEVDEELSSLNSSDSPPTRLKKEASRSTPVYTFNTTTRNPDGKLVEVEVELRQGAPGSPGVPNEVLVGLMLDKAKAAMQAQGCGAPMAEAIAAKVVHAAELKARFLVTHLHSCHTQVTLRLTHVDSC